MSAFINTFEKQLYTFNVFANDNGVVFRFSMNPKVGGSSPHWVEGDVMWCDLIWSDLMTQILTVS